MASNAYAAHLKTLIQRFETALDRAGYDQIVISAGSLVFVEDDDRAYPFNPGPFAQQWVPYDIQPDTFVVFTRGEKPRLIWPARADFWHLSPEAPQGDWTAHWTVEGATGLGDWLPKLTGRIAWLGPKHPALAEQGVSVDIDPAGLKAELCYYRAYKTDFEIECMAQANRNAVAGHLAARDAFFRSASEAAIYRDYLAASEQLESQEPYSGIVALNEAAATLHYERRRFTAPTEHRTLLIDAGARVNGYTSDITRTHTTDTGIFADLRLGLDALQQTLNASVKPGVAMSDLQNQALAGVAGLLQDHGLCRLPVEEQLAKRVPHAFFPHGLGHLLGLQVHDVGGHQQTPGGDNRADGDNPFLRLTRDLETSMVITMEPGLYFIPMLLEKLVQREPDHGLDLALIEQLKPYGGIRIEDNLVVSAQGARNLTREAFAAQE